MHKDLGREKQTSTLYRNIAFVVGACLVISLVGNFFLSMAASSAAVTQGQEETLVATNTGVRKATLAGQQTVDDAVLLDNSAEGQRPRVVESPDGTATKSVATLSAGWYIHTRDCSPVAVASLIMYLRNVAPQHEHVIQSIRLARRPHVESASLCASSRSLPHPSRLR